MDCDWHTKDVSINGSGSRPGRGTSCRLKCRIEKKKKPENSFGAEVGKTKKVLHDFIDCTGFYKNLKVAYPSARAPVPTKISLPCFCRALG